MKKILFVCLGNICRSPAAEGILKTLVEKENLSDKIEVSSAGTIGYHAGEDPDPRMKFHAAGRGYFLKSKAKQFNPEEDFEKYDYIITMDNNNFTEVKHLDENKLYTDKIHKMVEFSRVLKADEVPDPYMGGPQGFEKVMDILVDACRGLFIRIKNELK